jgi:hypothetical protein
MFEVAAAPRACAPPGTALILIRIKRIAVRNIETFHRLSIDPDLL